MFGVRLHSSANPRIKASPKNNINITPNVIKALDIVIVTSYCSVGGFGAFSISPLDNT